MFFHLCLYDWSNDEMHGQGYDPQMVQYIVRMGLRTFKIWPILFKDPPTNALQGFKT